MSFEAPAGAAQTGAAEQAFRPYLAALRRRWPIVLFIMVLAVVVAGVVYEREGTKYSASASVLVTPLPEGDAGFVGIGTVVDTGDPARTVQTAAALIDTPDAAAITARKLGGSWTTSSVQDAVSVTPRGASDVLAVTAETSNAAEAQRVANTYAESAVDYRASVVQGQIKQSINQLQAELTSLKGSASNATLISTVATAIEQLKAVQGTGREPTLSVSQTAESASEAGASKILILLLALLGGFALGSIAALGLETFSGPVRDREEVTRLFPAPILAAVQVVGGRRKGKGMPPWQLPPLVFEQFRMLRVQLSLSEGGSVIMVTSAGGGDGKTTVSASLAAAFGEAGRRVILMDFDVRKPDLPNLLQLGSRVADGEFSSPPHDLLSVPQMPGVRVMPTPTRDIRRFEATIDRLPDLLAEAKLEADVIIIDTAPVGAVSEALRIAPLCDQVVFVVRTRHTDRRRLQLARDLLARAGAPLSGLVLIGREEGMNDGDQSYAYAINQPTNDELEPRELRLMKHPSPQAGGTGSTPSDAAPHRPAGR
jgi:Mrp family chromosome partitioning ATPase/capsular polysaccharide biosynthesis protein